ncbi:MAG: phospho-N-acetylmuramoyl-pentapeptide-transferase [Deltaproteobacteria bacterium]|nr:MAG: phospho-N-acetylmuramoyl-pentapeptide-transferase [Deltaproteobacteria bacterium]
MLYYLLYQMNHAVNVVRYPTFRAIAAGGTALVVGLLLYPRFIGWLRSVQNGASNVREDTPERHKQKSGTPTMGGLLWLVACLGSTLLWGDLFDPKIWVLLLLTAGFGAVGFADDYKKLRMKNSKGLSARLRLVLQFVLSGALVTFLIFYLDFDTRVSFPVINFERFNPDIGAWYVPFAVVVIVGTANAVNMTDGLDGLAIGPVITSAFTFLVLAYAAGAVLFKKFVLANYLRIPHIPGAEELTVFCAAMMGAGISFLWYNTYPASVFMGDVGSLSMGGALGGLAVLTKNEIVSAIIHGVFLMEILSVIIQVTSFKLTGKRVFLMAPLHHHYELKGWPEPKIIVRFWVVSIMLALVGLASLKLR